MPKNKMPQTERKKINKELAKIKYSEGGIFHDVYAVLKKSGLIPLQEDDTELVGMFCGASGNVLLNIARSSSMCYDKNGIYRGRSKSGIDTYVPLSNTQLSLSWYKMPSGMKYEINAYLT